MAPQTAIYVAMLCGFVSLMLSIRTLQNGYEFGRAIRREQMRFLFSLAGTALVMGVPSLVVVTLWGKGHLSYVGVTILAELSLVIAAAVCVGLVFYKRHLVAKHPNEALLD